MEKAINNLLFEFHQASKLPVFVYNDLGHLNKKFRLKVIPDLPKEYLSHIFKIEPEKVKVFAMRENEYLSVIGTNNKQYRFILIWINSRTLEKTGYYEDRFPSIGIQRLISYTKVLYFALFRHFPVIKSPFEITDKTFAISPSQNKMIDNVHKTHQHNSYEKETLMLSAIESGNLSLFNKRLKEYIQSGTFGQMAIGNELRNKKDIAIAGTSLFTRAAIRGGLSTDAAFTLSDQCCQRIEQMSTLVSVSNLLQEIGAIFINRIKSQNKDGNSLVTRRMKDYINERIYDHLDLDKMAQTFGYTKSYMCTKFRQETGMTIIYFANLQKIKEAKSLLIFSDMSIAEISELLSFSDQSYLTRLFVQFEKITPRDYRQTYKA